MQQLADDCYHLSRIDSASLNELLQIFLEMIVVEISGSGLDHQVCRSSIARHAATILLSIDDSEASSNIFLHILLYICADQLQFAFEYVCEVIFHAIRLLPSDINCIQRRDYFMTTPDTNRLESCQSKRDGALVEVLFHLQMILGVLNAAMSVRSEDLVDGPLRTLSETLRRFAALYSSLFPLLSLTVRMGLAELTTVYR